MVTQVKVLRKEWILRKKGPHTAQVRSREVGARERDSFQALQLSNQLIFVILKTRLGLKQARQVSASELYPQLQLQENAELSVRKLQVTLSTVLVTAVDAGLVCIFVFGSCFPPEFPLIMPVPLVSTSPSFVNESGWLGQVLGLLGGSPQIMGNAGVISWLLRRQKICSWRELTTFLNLPGAKQRIQMFSYGLVRILFYHPIIWVVFFYRTPKSC